MHSNLNFYFLLKILELLIQIVNLSRNFVFKDNLAMQSSFFLFKFIKA